MEDSHPQPVSIDRNLVALAKLAGQRPGEYVLVLHLTDWRILATNLPPSLDSKGAAGPFAPLKSILQPSALAQLKRRVACELSAPFAEENLAAALPGLWRFEPIADSDLGLLLAPATPPDLATFTPSAIDDLTRLPTRGALLPLLARLLEGFKSAQKAFAVLFLDLDNFKQINDRFGHLAGDEILRSTAVGIQHAIRPGDGAVRFGGDEFVIAISGLHSPQDAFRIAKRVSEAATRPVSWRDETISFTASIGVAYSRDGDATVEQILDRADKAMYRAKTLGRSGRIELDC